jgi:DNA mismatch endonuclease, patch repair protein
VPDVLTPEQRSFNMSRIRGSNTGPERIVRKGLRAARIAGYKTHSSLPGKPDIVFPKAKLAVFVDGCFWHGCPEDYHEPETRREFWKRKIGRNITRDREVNATLVGQGWNVMRIWEHQVKRSPDQIIETLVARLKTLSARPR